jgi:FixJ family two-component response regulator
MSLLTNLTPPKRQFHCKVRTLLQTLDSKDAQILKEAIENVNGWPARTLQNALETRGVVLSDLTINRHRKNLCSCAG